LFYSRGASRTSQANGMLHLAARPNFSQKYFQKSLAIRLSRSYQSMNRKKHRLKKYFQKSLAIRLSRSYQSMNRNEKANKIADSRKNN